MDIGRTPAEVFGWIADPAKAMRWQAAVKEGTVLEETPGKVGTRFVERIEQGGRGLTLRGEIVDFLQDERISFRLRSRIHQVDVEYSVRQRDTGSTVTMISTIRWKFPMNVAARVLGGRVRQGILQQTSAEFAELKRLCEAGECSPGS